MYGPADSVEALLVTRAYTSAISVLSYHYQFQWEQGNRDVIGPLEAGGCPVNQNSRGLPSLSQESVW